MSPSPSSLPHPPLAIIVMGVSGSGKSTLSEHIAGTLRCSFLEGDAFHSDASVAKMQAGTPLTDEDRWPWLDRLGHAIDAAVARDGLVVAACSALRRVYRERLQAAITAPVRFVHLDNDREETLRRMAGRAGHYMPTALLDSQMATLERPDADEPALTLAADAPPKILCERALAWLASEAPGPAR